MDNNWFIKKKDNEDISIDIMRNIFSESDDSKSVFTKDKITLITRYIIENNKVIKTEIKVKREP